MANDNLARKIDSDVYSRLDAAIDATVKVNADRNDLESRFPRENLRALADAGWAC
ncbi:hypothetical protein [Bradyrhizobium sp. 139]|uniref:hypothetical protein n=1 Tax=Bradyrhizobium sp. 139 TaxID=2782616 RepID=UPI001FF7641D|nr:hypothetical protein [Bradyrhizobium sp. 139]